MGYLFKIADPGGAKDVELGTLRVRVGCDVAAMIVESCTKRGQLHIALAVVASGGIQLGPLRKQPLHSRQIAASACTAVALVVQFTLLGTSR
jgi:hypothetical protein